jgi:hypothetical protein
MFDDPAAHHTVDVHTGKRHPFPCRCDPQPRPQVRAAGRDTRGHPFPLGDLPLDRELEIGIGLAHPEDVRLGAFDPYEPQRARHSLAGDRRALC